MTQGKSKFAVGIVAMTAMLTLSGCAGAGLTMLGVGAGTAAGVGVNHTLNGIAYKTFTAPIAKVERATDQALARMDMKIKRSENTEDGRFIEASAESRDIEINLERLTDRATRMRVTAIQDIPILRDAATATEIIIQTASIVDDGAAVSMNNPPLPKSKPPLPKKTVAQNSGDK